MPVAGRRGLHLGRGGAFDEGPPGEPGIGRGVRCAAPSLSLSSSPRCSPVCANKYIGLGHLTLFSCLSWKTAFMVLAAARG